MWWHSMLSIVSNDMPIVLYLLKVYSYTCLLRLNQDENINIILSLLIRTKLTYDKQVYLVHTIKKYKNIDE